MKPKILVPLDGSNLAERAVEQAEKIAKALEYEVILFQVIQNPLANTPEAGPAAEERATLDTIDKANTYLKSIASGLEGKGIKTRVEVGEGPPYAGILGLAHKEDVDFIIMSTHGRTGLTRALMGSVAEKVVYTTKRPVMLVKPEKIFRARSDEAAAILSMNS
jgi:nucleotide-binding universal stress UspA family protein